MRAMLAGPQAISSPPTTPLLTRSSPVEGRHLVALNDEPDAKPVDFRLTNRAAPWLFTPSIPLSFRVQPNAAAAIIPPTRLTPPTSRADNTRSPARKPG